MRRSSSKQVGFLADPNYPTHPTHSTHRHRAGARCPSRPLELHWPRSARGQNQEPRHSKHHNCWCSRCPLAVGRRFLIQSQPHNQNPAVVRQPKHRTCSRRWCSSSSSFASGSSSTADLSRATTCIRRGSWTRRVQNGTQLAHASLQISRWMPVDNALQQRAMLPSTAPCLVEGKRVVGGCQRGAQHRPRAVHIQLVLLADGEHLARKRWRGGVCAASCC